MTVKGTRVVIKRIITLLILLLSLQAHAATYYCDPVSGNTATGTGLAGDPWGTLESVWRAGKFGGNPITGGDTVKLETGFHGLIDVYHNNSPDYVTIEPNDDAVPDVNFVMLDYADYWHFKGLRISPSFSNQDTAEDRGSFYGIISGTSSKATHIKIEDCEIFTTDDTSEWTAEDWKNIAYNGVYFAYPENCLFHGNHIRNIRSALYLDKAKYMTVEENLCENMSGDCIGIDGENHTIQNNIGRDWYDDEFEGTHADCIQIMTILKEISSMSDYGGGYVQVTASSHGLYAGYIIVIYNTTNYNNAFTVVERLDSNNFTIQATWVESEAGRFKRIFYTNNITIKNNLFIGRTDPERESIDDELQGFFLEGIDTGEIYNNVILVPNTTHGISINTYAKDLDIYNNTVIGLYGAGTQPGINNTATGSADWGCENVRFINNISHSFPTEDSNSPPDPLPPGGWTNVVVHTNYDIDSYDPNTEFTSWSTGDMSLLEGSSFIDVASLALYSPFDINDNPRNVSPPDVGPYEYGMGKRYLFGFKNN